MTIFNRYVKLPEGNYEKKTDTQKFFSIFQALDHSNHGTSTLKSKTAPQRRWLVKNLQVANEAYLVPHQIRWIPDT
jgi:hypothetical protein